MEQERPKRRRAAKPADRGSPGPSFEQIEERVLPAWLRPTAGENRVPVAAAILVAAVLQFLLPEKFVLVRPHWLVSGVELLLLATLVALNPLRLTRHSAVTRPLNLVLVGIISLDNGVSAVLLDGKLIQGSAGSKASSLLASAAAIYLTNVIAFGIWYWELDRGGPFERAAATSPYPDFLFPQMTQQHLAPADWEPQFGDYLYVSVTNATAFSPTDTMPLTRWAKLLMTIQAAVALSTTALVIARAVNILK